MTRAIFIVVYIAIVQLWICWCQSLLKYRLNEETEPGFVLGNINSYINPNFDENEQYEVSLIHKYFSIENNRDLIVKKRIDLERFCNDANLCCGSEPCIVAFTVLINTRSSRRTRLNIEIEVLDINDNKPMFKNASQIINIPENSRINTKITLEGGYDNDMSTANQIQIYKFSEPTNTFELDSSELSSLSLLLLKPIDYEQQNLYPARLEACDNATRCVLQPISIQIQDENDNYPTFDKPRYEIKIPESFEIGKVVIAARAIDRDGAQFNKTKYGFHNNRDPNLAMKFRIVETSGDIVLLSKLSAQQREIYSFKIFAMDIGSYVSGKRDIADVMIQILDINDNKPVIEVFKMDRITNDRESFEMTIAENEPPQKLMSIKVTDADLGLNAKVVCELKDHTSSLELKFFEPDVYEINNLRHFDYEQETQIKAIFECKDSGTPQLSSYKSIRINIEDVNEYSPEFDQTEFHGSVKENTGPGETVLTVRATDKDRAAILTYTIDEKASPYFSINHATGIIKTALRPFDRELISTKEFRVTVTDAAVNARTTDATVQISILDENDNDPLFVLSSLQFFISENQPEKSKLQGKIVANDADKDPSNSYISFKLIDTFDSELRKCDRPYFRIRHNGELETVAMLDREINPNFTITIEARDKGNPPRFTRANATVIIHDINDNAPQWIYPRPPEKRINNVNSLPMLNFTESTERFLLIMKLKAHDPDQNEAGRVSYILVNHHESLFSLNETNGELRTEKSPLPYGQYQLQLRATDHGNPIRNSDSWILINIIDSGKLANINLTIIIGMVAITALISLFLIIAIICVRRRPRFQQSYSTHGTEANKDESNEQYLQNHNQWMYQPADDSTMPPLSDNESCVYLPSNFYETQDPLILQTINGSRPASRLDYPLMLPSSHNSNCAESKFVNQSSYNIERASGTLRSNNGLYCTMNASSSGVIINGQELDGDSADSGKGASEVDLRLQNHLNNANRNYPTMPFPHHSTAKSTFGGYVANLSGPQYYPATSNPKSLDSRFLTIHPTNMSVNRRAMSPTLNSNSQCQCFILPEDDVIQVGYDNNQLPMSTFSQPTICNQKSSNHEHNYIYGDDILSSVPGAAFYSHCPYIQGHGGRLTQSPLPFLTKDSIINDQDTLDNDHHLDSYNNNNFEIKRKKSYSSSEQLNQENNIYTLAIAN